MNDERIYEVLRAPHVSEKSTNVGEYHNQVVFKVAGDATKPEIKTAVSQLFNVSVKRVTTCNVKPEAKGFRGVPGKRPGWKKAYVTLAEGEDIDFLDGAAAPQG